MQCKTRDFKQWRDFLEAMTWNLIILITRIRSQEDTQKRCGILIHRVRIISQSAARHSPVMMYTMKKPPTTIRTILQHVPSSCFEDPQSLLSPYKYWLPSQIINHAWKNSNKTDEGGTIPFKKSIFLFKLDGYLFGQAHLLGTHSLWKGICRLAQCLHRRWKTLFPFPWKRTKRKTHVTPNNATSDATILHAVHTFWEVTCFPPFGYSEMAEIYEPARG